MSYATFTAHQMRAALEPHTKVSTVKHGGGACITTERGARLLGLFPRPDLPNVLWVHAHVGARLAEGHWQVGGERLWISPERSFFYENPRDFDGFHVPADIDPGNYRSDGDRGYRNCFALLDRSTSVVHENALATRRFTPIDDPYGSALAFAGARIEDSVSVQSAAALFAAWSISMVYTCGADRPGTALFPIAPGGRILSYFDPIPSERADVQDGYARFRIDGDAVYKLAIAPEDMRFDTPCVGVYVSPYPDSDTWFCVVKRCDALPRSQDECVDVAKRVPDGPKGAIQSYNNGSGAGPVEATPFGEIEIQMARARMRDGRWESGATHDLLAYAGPQQAILELAGTILGIDGRPRLYV